MGDNMTIDTYGDEDWFDDEDDIFDDTFTESGT